MYKMPALFVTRSKCLEKNYFILYFIWMNISKTLIYCDQLTSKVFPEMVMNNLVPFEK